MKKKLVQIGLALAACCARGQGTLQFDQSVSPTNAPGGFLNIEPEPTGESFIPTLSSIGFVQFYLNDGGADEMGSTLFVDVWSGSLTNGVLLGQTSPVTVGSFLAGVTTFFFSNSVALASGNTYYLEPVIQSGDSEQVGVDPGTYYASGIEYLAGTPEPGGDLWFREGIVVPEPSSFPLAILGLVGIYPALRNRRNLNPKAHREKLCSEEQPSQYSPALSTAISEMLVFVCLRLEESLEST